MASNAIQIVYAKSLYSLSWFCPSQLRNLLWGAVGVGILVFFFLLLWLILRRSERRLETRKRELERQREAMREASMQIAEREEEAKLSVEDRARMEMSENIMNLIRQHPEDAVKTLRTWVRQ